MAISTENSYGQITISDEAIALIAGSIALDAYGVVENVSRSFSDSVKEVFKKKRVSRGVKIKIVKDRIHINLNVVFKFGTSIKAVAESLRNTVKYGVENFTGTVVSKVNINVAGIKL